MAMLDNITSYWKLDETSGVEVTDIAGAYNLLAVNAPFTAGKLKNGADFGATNSTKYLLNTSVISSPSYPLTVSFWFKPAAVVDVATPLGLSGDTVDYYRICFKDTSHEIIFRSNNSSLSGDLNSGVVAQTGTWYHAVFIIHSTTSGSFYLNGTEVAREQPIYAATVSRFGVGALTRTTPTAWFSGMVDEIGLWSRSLSAAEVSTLYNGGVGLSYPFAGNSLPSLDSVSGMMSTDGSQSSLTLSHTCGGSQRYLIAMTTGRNGNVSGVTYNGSAMTLLDRTSSPSDADIAWWGLVNPAEGTHDLVVSSSPAQIMYLGGMSFYNTKQSTPTNKVTGTTSVTATVSLNSILVGYSYGDSVPPSSGANTRRVVYGNGMCGFVSNPLNLAAGSRVLNFTNGSHSLGVELEVSTSIKTMAGVDNASVKTVNGVARASVKSIVGIS